MPKQHIAHISARLELESPLTPNQESYIVNNVQELVSGSPVHAGIAYCGVRAGEERTPKSPRNTDIMLAALRTLQRAMENNAVPEGVDEIIDMNSVSSDDIDRLCEDVNFEDSAMRHAHEMTDTREVIDWEEADALAEGDTPEPKPRYIRKTTYNNEVMMEFFNDKQEVELGLVIEINKGLPCVHIDAGSDSLLAVSADKGKLTLASDYCHGINSTVIGYGD